MDLSLAQAFITALTGSADTVCNWRVINDRNKGEQGINLKGSLVEVAAQLQYYNSMYYGIFININAIKPDSNTCTLADVEHIRTYSYFFLLTTLTTVISCGCNYNRS